GWRRGDDYDAGFGYRITFGAVFIQVVSDNAALGYVDVGRHDGAANTAGAPDFGIRQQDAAIDIAIAVDPNSRREHASGHAPTGNNAARRHDGIHRHSHAAPFLGEDEFGRRLLQQARSYRPVLVVQVEFRNDRDQVHVGLVVSVQSADVAPIAHRFLIQVAKIVGNHFASPDATRNNVTPKIVRRIRIFCIL